MTGPRDADACEGRGELTAQPARELVHALGEEGDGVISICADDYRPVLQMIECGIFIDAVVPGFDPARVALRGDGLAECDFDEVLPAPGPITHCAQLADYGRAAEPVRLEDGREVCRLQQLRGDDARAGHGYGWYLADANERLPEDPRLRSPCVGVLGGYGVFPQYALGTAHVPNSTVQVRCATVAGEPTVPRCDQSEAGASRDGG